MLHFLQTMLSRWQDGPIPDFHVPLGPPRSLFLETGVFPVMSAIRYKVTRGTITRLDQACQARNHQRKPAPEEWDSFWTTVEGLGVRYWRANYQQPRRPGLFTLDGNGWRLRLEVGAFKVHSNGRGAYPSITAPHEPTDSSAVLQSLQTALDSLVDGPPVGSCDPETDFVSNSSPPANAGLPLLFENIGADDSEIEPTL